MSYPAADVLNLIPTVLELNVVIARGGGWTLGLDVVDSAGLPLTLTGTTATITMPGVSWAATTSGSRYTWDIAKSAVDAITFQVGDARLVVSDGTHTVVWAVGKARVI